MTDKMTLYIGDKHLSSWSMRPWLLMKQFEIPFREVIVRLDQKDTEEEIAKISPSKRVPVLKDNDILVWDSLAVCEYLAEKFPRDNLWPESTKQRAFARSMCAEMHSGFLALRKECSMDLLKVSSETKVLSDSAKADIQRIDRLFHSCKEMLESKGAFLFGKFGIVDAYFMPVIARFRSYRIPLEQKRSSEYFHHMIEQPIFKLWIQEAEESLP